MRIIPWYYSISAYLVVHFGMMVLIFQSPCEDGFLISSCGIAKFLLSLPIIIFMVIFLVTVLIITIKTKDREEINYRIQKSALILTGWLVGSVLLISLLIYIRKRINFWAYKLYAP